MHRAGLHVAAYEDGLKGVSHKKLVKQYQIAREDFISSKLTPKLAQQLKVSPRSTC